jgi:outer membrane lipoprotein-sorting protein
LFSIVSTASAFTADELIAKNIEARGGIDKIRAVHSLRETGTVRFGGGGQGPLVFVSLSKRENMIRAEISRQGLTAIDAYDGSVGWSVSPFRGRKDPEKMSADDVKQMQLEADMDGPLVDYKSKGNTVEYMGTEDVDGTDAHKLKVTLKNGDVRFVFLDPDYFLEIRILDQVKIRGVEQESETDLGDYEQVNGVFLPFSIEVGSKGGPKFQKFTIEKAEVNVDLDDSLFHFPVTAGK